YSELLQLAKGWGDFISDRIIIWRLHNECFSPSDKKMFVHQKYEKVTPDRIIKFCDFYLMNTIEEKNIWYRGRKDVNGNWEYICYSDSLDEAFSFL
ncbi:MAG: hypothetical protein K1W26_06210, partial [Acetatifactor sp.]